ncbi:MAG TPA: CBS domain-containing protein [Nitrospiraceae bacterium]|jgi:signal-transduction protein with cAMP-binding, CBS, and nucleotidyltransferase domain|nr:CBS domain-containing protein [Nitrospiraceae bacterium]
MSTLVQVMRKELKQVRHDAVVRDAAKRMRDEKVSSLLVEKNKDLVGIITDTDVVRRAVAEGSDLMKTTVDTIMTSPIATIESLRTVQDAHDMMGDLGVRHLGVTEQGKLVGVVSVRDLLVYFKRVSEPKISQD